MTVDVAAAAASNTNSNTVTAGERTEAEAGTTSVDAAIVAPPRVPTLYRDAVQSVVRMLPLVDVSRCMAVSRMWSAVVRSMASLRASIRGVRLDRLHAFDWVRRACASPHALARHVGLLDFKSDYITRLIGWDGLDASWIQTINGGFTNLTGLSCELVPASSGSGALHYTFPPRLTSLQVVIRFPSVVGEQSVLNAIGELSHLQRLALLIDQTKYGIHEYLGDEIDMTGDMFAPLLRLQHLTHFTYHVKRTMQARRIRPGNVLLPVDIECIRRMPALTSLSLFNGGKSSDEPLRVLPQLLSCSLTSQLQSFNLRHAARMSKADLLSLIRFSNLTRLRGSFRLADFSPLRTLTRLTEVDVDLAPVEGQSKVDMQGFFNSILASVGPHWNQSDS